MSKETITVALEITPQEKERFQAGALVPALDTKLMEALAEHDKEQNPMGLPWRAVAIPYTSCSHVVDRHGHIIASGLSDEAAKMIAAAPELADVVDRGTPKHYWWGKAIDALKKAGRR